MPRSTQVQRLRAQLAASQEEVRALKQQVASLCTENAVTSRKLVAAAEQRMLQRVAAADARCRDALQRAEAAELRLLEHVEADHRAGSIKEEKDEWDELLSTFPDVVECVRRTGLMAAEDAAREELIAARAASRDAVRRRRKMLRKRKQQQRRKHRGDADPAHQEERPGSGSDNIDAVHCVTAHSAVSKARKALFIDNICFWVAAFVPYSWAPVNSEAARTVFKVLNITKQGWKGIRFRMGKLQTMGVHYPCDNEKIGPGVGLIYSGHLAIQTLRNDVFRLARADRNSITGEFSTRWLLYMDNLLNMYDALRLGVKELYFDTMMVLFVSHRTRNNIQAALETYGRRKQTGNEPDGDVVDEADSAA